MFNYRYNFHIIEAAKGSRFKSKAIIHIMKPILHIDTSQANKIKVRLAQNGDVSTKESEQKFGSQVLLSLIQDLVSESKIKLQDLTAIKVVTGPGSFTGLRVGVAVANALAYSLDIPVNDKKM